MSNRKKIHAAISALLTRDNEDAFVIFEHVKTGKFVQFAGAVNGVFMLDLPSETLSEDEFLKATQYFKALGIEVLEYDAFELDGDRVVGKNITFNQDFRSVPEATQAVLDIFDQVYGFADDCDISITEN